MTEKIPAYNWTNADNNKMTENKLTLADWYKYYEADVQFTTDDNTIQRGYVRAIQVHSDTELEIECFPISFYHKAVSDCKLILRGITQLTDEEKEKIVKTYLEDNLEEWTNSDEVFSLILDTCSFEELVTFFDYLRKIGVDIDGLIEIGKAVKDV